MSYLICFCHTELCGTDVNGQTNWLRYDDCLFPFLPQCHKSTAGTDLTEE